MSSRRAVTRVTAIVIACVIIAVASLSTALYYAILPPEVVVITPTPPAETIAGATIRVLGFQDPYWFAVESLIPEFEAETGIKVIFEGISSFEMHARATSAFISESPDIDVALCDIMWLGEWADNGWIIPVDDRMMRDREELDIMDFVPIAMHLCLWRGKFWGLPTMLYSMLTMYRTDVFEELGLREPPKSFEEDYEWWTWDKYMEYVEKIDGTVIDGERVYGTIIVGQWPSPIVHMWSEYSIGHGVRWFESFPEAPWDFTVTIDEKGVEAAEYYKKLYEHSPPESIGFMWFDAGIEFGKGRAGLLTWWSPYAFLCARAGYMVPELSYVAEKNVYGVALPPHPKGWKLGDGPVMAVGGGPWVISKYSRYKEASWKFIKWYASKETQKKMALMQEPSPYQYCDIFRYSLCDDPEIREHYFWLPTLKASLENHFGDSKICRPSVGIYTVLEGILGRYLNEVLLGEISVEDAMAHVKKEFTTALEGTFHIPYGGLSSDDTVDYTERHMKELAGS